MAGVTRRFISASEVEPPAGIFSQSVFVGDTMYFSGQMRRDVNGQFTEGFEAQTRQTLTNNKNVVKSAGNGTDLTNVVKITALLTDMKDFQTFNEVYKEFFKPPYQARAAYAIKSLALDHEDALVEVEGVAIVGPINDQK